MSTKKLPCVIGLCGRSGAGKSFVSRIFEKQGVPAIDTDEVYREMTGVPRGGVMSSCMTELVSAFGEYILSSDGALDRKALSRIVFGKGGREKLDMLNSITHKYILSEAERRIERFHKNGAWAVIVDAPLLFESGFDKKCDFIVAASAPQEILVERIISRDRLDTEAALRRLAAQLSDDDVRHRADFVIETDAPAERLYSRVANVLSEIRTRWVSLES